jgi:hypothetical protein
MAQYRTLGTSCQLPLQFPNGTGKIRFHRETIFAALPLWMPALAQLLASTGPLSERQMAETAGRFSPAAQHKLCGLFPSSMRTTERQWAKAAPSWQPRMRGFSGCRRQAEQPFSFVVFPSAMQVTEQRWVKVGAFCGPPTAERTGHLRQAGPQIRYSASRLLMRIREQRWGGVRNRWRKHYFTDDRWRQHVGKPGQPGNGLSFRCFAYRR